VSDQPSMLEMMKQARDLQKKMKKAQKRVGKTEITATAGDGRVTVIMNGKLEVQRIDLDPQLIAEGNVRAIQDLVTSAVNAAIQKAQDVMAEEMKEVTGGLNVPGLF
jgi:nucleoid-associated protein EbfC